MKKSRINGNPLTFRDELAERRAPQFDILIAVFGPNCSRTEAMEKIAKETGVCGSMVSVTAEGSMNIGAGKIAKLDQAVKAAVGRKASLRSVVKGLDLSLLEKPDDDEMKRYRKEDKTLLVAEPRERVQPLKELRASLFRGLFKLFAPEKHLKDALKILANKTNVPCAVLRGLRDGRISLVRVNRPSFPLYLRRIKSAFSELTRGRRPDKQLLRQAIQQLDIRLLEEQSELGASAPKPAAAKDEAVETPASDAAGEEQHLAVQSAEHTPIQSVPNGAFLDDGRDQFAFCIDGAAAKVILPPDMDVRLKRKRGGGLTLDLDPSGEE